jgi:hypothetical protein
MQECPLPEGFNMGQCRYPFRMSYTLDLHTCTSLQLTLTSCRPAPDPVRTKRWSDSENGSHHRPP